MSGGSVFLFNKRILRFFRKDGYRWRRNKDGKTAGEAHERLKVGNIEALNCYYAHGEHNPSFQSRSYWMLDSAYEHIVLVHYREITDQVNYELGCQSTIFGRISACHASLIPRKLLRTMLQAEECSPAQVYACHDRDYGVTTVTVPWSVPI
ncbi:hypothetical protein Dimus_008172 [Dionaea muscipula]